MNMENALFKIVDLEINPTGKPKLSKKKLRKILEEYEFDDDFIENVNDDIMIGFDAAITICKKIVSDECHESFTDSEEIEKLTVEMVPPKSDGRDSRKNVRQN